MLLWEADTNFTFSARANFQYRRQFDQCGIILYLNDRNWFKASIEHEVNSDARLGSVVTNDGYSDWATTDIAPVEQMYYQLSRRGPDFLVERSADGVQYTQMRIFHMMALGETTEAMGKADWPLRLQPGRFNVCGSLRSVELHRLYVETASSIERAQLICSTQSPLLHLFAFYPLILLHKWGDLQSCGTGTAKDV